MRILFVLEHYYPYIGGAEKLFRDLAEGLAATGREVHVITTRFDKKLPAREIINGVKVRRIHCYSRYLFTFLSLPSVIRQARKCDLVHTTTYNAALPAWLGARITRKPVVVTFHELWGKLWFRLPFVSFFAKNAFYLYEQLISKLPFDHFVAVSDFTKDALVKSGIHPGKVTRIYNGLDYGQFESYSHQPSTHFQVAFYGRLGISKGLDLLLPAARQFFQRYPECKLVLILPRKPSGIFNRVNRLIQDLQIEKNLQLRHELSKKDLYETICGSSAVVIPSYSEGFCFVAAEAVALGVPIISSGQGALKEVVSGQVVTCREQTVEGVYQGLCEARAGQWMPIETRMFPLKEAVEAYQRLYQNLF
ncbi:MAG: glycosyltransferase family 4 protein [Saprospiraceae bacterium]|nr:glycosyltransferase family 4 protein [Saprospiraceae bacterium]